MSKSVERGTDGSQGKTEYVTKATKRQLPWILVRCICFLVCFTVLLVGVSGVLARKSLLEPWNMSVKVGGFYNEPENSIDTIFFGSSHMYCSVDPVQLKELNGRNTYILATQEQPVWLSYYYMKEALKTQTPETMVFEINMVTADSDYAEDGANYSALDPIRFSKNKIDMVNAAAPWRERLNFLFNVFKYHERWEDLVVEEDIKQEYKREKDPYRGYVKLEMTSPQAFSVEPSGITEVKAPIGKVTDYLNRIIDLAEEQGCRLIFLKAPSNPLPEDQMLYNAAFQLAEQRGVEWLDCNQYYREIGIDPQTDFFDGHHLNVSGVAKLTAFLAQKLWPEPANLANSRQL